MLYCGDYELACQSEGQLKSSTYRTPAPTVVKWMKRHGISILWVDVQKHMRRYCPDFIVEYIDGHKSVLEVKDPSRVDSDEVKSKRKAAEMWCKRRGMEYIVAMVD